MSSLELKVERSLAIGLGRHKFMMISEDPITEKLAMEMQNPDYPVAAYDFYGFSCRKRPDGLYQATWYCNNSCD